MDINHIKEFITLARCLSYTDAAKLNFTSVSAVSRHICSIENELGFTLFERNKHSVQITEKGLQFFRRIEPIIIAYDNAIAENRLEKMEESIVIGVHYAEGHKKVFEYIKQFLETHKGINIQFKKTTNHDFQKLLFDRTIDIAMEYQTNLHEHENLSCVKLKNERFVIAYPQSRESKLMKLGIKMLSIEQVFLPNLEDHPGAEEVIRLIEKKNKISISNIKELRGLNEVFMRVSLGEGITVIPQEYSMITPPGISKVYFEGLPQRPLTALFLKNNNDHNVSELVSFLIKADDN